MSSSAALMLKKQLAELNKSPVEGFSAGLKDENLFHWEILVIPPEGSLYEGGMFKAELEFPEDYPSMPPKMRFTGVIPYHPNIYDNGEVCISILHPPTEDEYGYEDAGERWLPVHTVTTILLSVIAMLSSPNDESPANITAAKQWREDPDGFKRKVRNCVRRSQEENFE